MTINELIKTAHSDAKAKGWWDEERNTGELLMLIVSECGEALEAHRSGRRADLVAFDACVANERTLSHIAYASAHDPDLYQTPFQFSFKEHIKDTFEDELADIVIRIADYMGHSSYPKEEYEMPLFEIGSISAPKNVGEALLQVCSCFTPWRIMFYGNETRKFTCNHKFAIQTVVAIAKAHNIDLERHIQLKLAYNKTRPYKHNKAY